MHPIMDDSKHAEQSLAAAPRHNLTGDPYFTDGNRAVLILSGTDTQAAFLDWS